MFLGKKIGIALEPTVIRMCVRGQRSGVSQPACIALPVEGQDIQLMQWGSAALELMASSPKEWDVVWPLLTASDFDARQLEVLLKGAVRAFGRRPPFFRPEVLVSIPSRLDGTTKLLVLETLARCGTKTSFLVERSVIIARDFQRAHARQAGLVVFDCTTLGTECSVILDQFVISQRTVLPDWGKNATNTIGRQTTATSSDLRKAWLEVREHGTKRGTGKDSPAVAYIRAICAGLRELEQETPSTVWEEVARPGLVVSGDLHCDDELIVAMAEVTGYTVRSHDHPDTAVENGLAIALDDWESSHRAVNYVR